MKIVNLETFRSLPPNTVYAKYRPVMFDNLAIKGDTWEFDFLTTSPFSSAIACSNSEDYTSKCEQAEHDGKSISMDFNSQGRDGCFADDRLFAVWEPTDVCALIKRLRQCLPTSS